MQLAQPELDFLMSKANQERTSDGFQAMGHRLAAEVAQYLHVSPVQHVVHGLQLTPCLWLAGVLSYQAIEVAQYLHVSSV